MNQSKEQVLNLIYGILYLIMEVHMIEEINKQIQNLITHEVGEVG